MDFFSVLNYQGSKKNLIEFIHRYAQPYIAPGDPMLDIFAGTCSVGYSYKRTNPVFANDSELYSYVISKALLGDFRSWEYQQVLEQISPEYMRNYQQLQSRYQQLYLQEQALLHREDTSKLIAYYESFPTIFNGGVAFQRQHDCFELFVSYFAGSYFGLAQAMEIDSLRYAIGKFQHQEIYYPLLTSLFFAMKECVFSKDGHMAQPLDLQKNKAKLFKQRGRSVRRYFEQKFKEFFGEGFVWPTGSGQVFQGDFVTLLKNPQVQREVKFIYADPPYTDMQYSRYYHLLNIVSRYDYPKPTKTAAGFTKGLYTDGRFQSKLSNKSTCLKTLCSLIEFSNQYGKNLAISFAYPRDRQQQKVDRYVMQVDELIRECAKVYGAPKVEAICTDYTHSNNRNSESKKVLEYLILCKGR